LNALTHELFTVEHLTSMTAETVCELLPNWLVPIRASQSASSWTTRAISGVPSLLFVQA